MRPGRYRIDTHIVSGGVGEVHFDYRRDPPCSIGEVLDFVGVQRTAEDGALTVGEPFLENLVAAETVGPDGGDVAPEGFVVEVDVKGRLAECGQRFAHRGAFIRGKCAFDDPALARHHGVAMAVMAPTGGQGKIVFCQVACSDRRGGGDGRDLRPQRRLGQAGDGGVGIEQRRQFAPARRRPRELLRRPFRPSGQSDKVERFIDLMKPLGLVEVARTGAVAISRGTEGI